MTQPLDDDVAVGPEHFQASLSVDDARWGAANIERVSSTALTAMSKSDSAPPIAAALDLLFTDDAAVAALNERWRGLAKPTNVLAFPSGELIADGHDGVASPEGGMPQVHLGGVVLAFETVEREADDRGIPLADHASHLIIHGVLHLLGYDHVREPDRLLMEGIEVAILNDLGIGNPYDEED